MDATEAQDIQTRSSLALARERDDKLTKFNELFAEMVVLKHELDARLGKSPSLREGYDG